MRPVLCIGQSDNGHVCPCAIVPLATVVVVGMQVPFPLVAVHVGTGSVSRVFVPCPMEECVEVFCGGVSKISDQTHRYRRMLGSRPYIERSM